MPARPCLQGVAVFGLAFVVSILQDDDQEGIKLFR